MGLWTLIRESGGLCSLFGHANYPAGVFGRAKCARCGAVVFQPPLIFPDVGVVDRPEPTPRVQVPADSLILVGVKMAEVGMPLAWLFAAHEALDGMSPSEACQHGQVDRVFELIEIWASYQDHDDV